MNVFIFFGKQFIALFHILLMFCIFQNVYKAYSALNNKYIVTVFNHVGSNNSHKQNKKMSLFKNVYFSYLVVSCNSKCGGTQNFTLNANRMGLVCPWQFTCRSIGFLRFNHSFSPLLFSYLRPK